MDLEQKDENGKLMGDLRLDLSLVKMAFLYDKLDWESLYFLISVFKLRVNVYVSFIYFKRELWMKWCCILSHVWTTYDGIQTESSANQKSHKYVLESVILWTVARMPYFCL